MSYVPNGKMSSHAFLKGGKMHGLPEVFYADDKQDGEFLTLAEDGKVLAHKVWLDGEVDGWSFESHDNGQRHGLLQVWASDGSLLQLVPYEHGKKQGIERRWDELGKQVWEKTWQAGVPVPVGL
ncbi:toxin-antitoxin system YwqK family antitoxin [Janthinobacterium sp. LB3P118]|uniref:toxin-antitoxin system YwqK family antitoxin n=1 Tax=Janthinobacterium sp. LB3P118 TaxID=3424195 RepID=UPI003F22DBA0